jgi:GTP pyrophosphokinase
VGLQAVEKQDFVPFLSKKYPAIDDVYVALGREELAVELVVEKLLPILQEREEEKAHHNGPSELKALPAQAEGVLYHKHGVVKLASCCCPLPGDAIVGYLHPNRGMIVHRSDCRMVRRYRGQGRPLVEVNWLQIEARTYLAPIQITGSDRPGLLRDVAAVVADAGINMTAVSSTTHASLQKAVITATLEIETVDQLELIFKRLQLIQNVTDVKRSL